MEEADGLVLMAAISTDEALGLRRPDAEAATDTVNPHLDAISILTCRPAVTETAAHPVPFLAPDLLPDPLPVRRTVDTVVDLGTAAAARIPYLRHPSGAAEKRGAARIMVIDTSPLLAVHPAHQFPEEPKAPTA